MFVPRRIEEDLHSSRNGRSRNLRHHDRIGRGRTSILVPTGFEYLDTIVFILVIAALVQVVEMFLKKNVPSLYQALGVYLPLITTNCAVLGVALKNVTNNYNILQGVVYGLGTGLGYFLAIVILAGIREKYRYNEYPKYFKGTAMTLITAGLMSMAFFGFSGMI